MLGSSYQKAQCHIPENLNPHGLCNTQDWKMGKLV